MRVTMAPGAVWSYDEHLVRDGRESIEIRFTSDADGADVEIEGCEGAGLRKGQRDLTPATRKDLTASDRDPITITTPPHGMVIRAGRSARARQERP
jgi:hypothetical protein